MIRQFALGSLLLALSGCDQFSSPKPEEAPLPGEESLDTAMAAADAMASADKATSPQVNVPSGPIPPETSAKRTAIEKSLKGIWRDTPYEIVNIQYVAERMRGIGETGTQYEANISVAMKFPSGWLSDCVGPNAPWGCQHVDSNMMQLSRNPIRKGEARTYSGTLSMGRSSRQGWQSKGSEPNAQWRQEEGAWDSRISWTQAM